MPLRDLFLRVHALVAKGRVERELDGELSFHIERETLKHIAAGLSPEDARRRALARFGSVPLAADGCRDARGTGLVDDLARDIHFALRTFRRAPLSALTIVATVALGLGLVTAVFEIYNAFVLHGDAVRNADELFGVTQKRIIGPGGADEDVPLTRPDYEAMRRETSVFTDAVAMVGPRPTRIEGRIASSSLVTGNFFQVLRVQAALGRPLTPDDDERFAGRPVIVLSHAGWWKLFAGNPAAIGRGVVINGAPYDIVGVMPDGFRGLGLTPPDYWAPLAIAGQFRDDYVEEDKIAVDVVGRLKPGVLPEAATSGLTAWASRRIDGGPAMITLTPRQGTLSAELEALLVASPIFLAFGLILLIGCANVANLLLARGVSRQRELGVRLSLGASRRRLIRQLLTESFLLSLAAAACGLVVSRLFLKGGLHALTTTLPAEAALLVSGLNLAAPAPDWRVLLFLVAGAIVSTAFFGLAPAVQATRLDTVRTIRGEVTRDARPGRARQALIAGQVGASALLLICAAIFLRGAFAAATRAPSVRISDTVRVSVATEPRRAALLQAVTAHPLVEVVASSSVPRVE